MSECLNIGPRMYACTHNTKQPIRAMLEIPSISFIGCQFDDIVDTDFIVKQTRCEVLPDYKPTTK